MALKLYVAVVAAFVLAPATARSQTADDPCRVVDGVVAELAPGPFLPGGETVTLKTGYRAEFRWNPMDREAIGWMRISDADGRELGWVPAGHEGVRCGQGY